MCVGRLHLTHEPVDQAPSTTVSLRFVAALSLSRTIFKLLLRVHAASSPAIAAGLPVERSCLPVEVCLRSSELGAALGLPHRESSQRRAVQESAPKSSRNCR